MAMFEVKEYNDIEVVKELFKGYARIMLNTMLEKAKELGFAEVTFTTKPSVMQIGYGLYKRMGFEETGEKEGIVSMRMAVRE